MASIKKELESFTDEFEGELEKQQILGVHLTRKISIPLFCCCAVVVLIVSISLGAALGTEESKWSQGTSVQGSTTSPRYDALVELLEPLVGKSINDKGTAENKALLWLAYDDPANVPLDSHLDYITQRFVLAALFEATNGRAWKPSCSFMSYKTVCDWNLGDDENGAFCTGGFITYLVLDDMGLNGTLPHSIGLLTHLEHFQIIHNGLTGTIPASMELMNQLTHLDFRTSPLKKLDFS
jgi:hypothetical protein